MTRTPKLQRLALWLFPVVIVVGGFLSSAVWIKQTFGAAAVLILAAIASVFVMGYSLYLSARAQRGMDEVQRASAGFSARWGPSLGHIVFVMLLLLPPFQSLMTNVVAGFSGEDSVDAGVVMLSMTLGFIGVVVLQAIGTIVMNAIWWNTRQ